MNKNLWGSLVLVLLMGLPIACSSDTAAAQELNGRWELTSASIDGEDSDRLENLYFEFLADQMNTNILGEDGTYPFHLHGSVIDQESEPAVSYEFQIDSDSTLALSTDIRGKTFVFHLLRAEMLNEASEVL